MNIHHIRKPLCGVLLLLLGLQAGFTHAADKRSRDLHMLEAAETIKQYSQEAAKAYFYQQQHVRTAQAIRDLEDSLTAFDNAIKELNRYAKDEEDKNMLQFLAFTVDELKQTTSEVYNEEYGALMLDYSDSLLEGAELIEHKHAKRNSYKESMLITTEDMAFLLERITKYYIAFRAGFRDYNNVMQLQQAVKDFESGLAEINTYKGYPKSIKARVRKLNAYWKIAKKFYLGIEKGALPVIVSSSTDHMVRILDHLRDYHRKILAAGNRRKR